MSNKSSVVPNKSGCGEEDVKELEKDTSLIDSLLSTSSTDLVQDTDFIIYLSDSSNHDNSVISSVGENNLSAVDDDSTFWKGDSVWESMDSISNESDNLLDALIIPILGKHLNVLQKSAIVIPIIIKVLISINQWIY